MARPTFLYTGLIVFLVIMLGGTVDAIEKQPADRLLDARYSQVGLRLGFWATTVDEKPIPSVNLDADLPDAGFYTELFFDYRIARPLFAELSLGIASRGDVVILDSDDKYIGTINLYPVLLQLKLSPLSGASRSFHPFIIAGGGFVWGRQTIDIVTFGNDLYYNPDITGKTETDFIGVLGGGVDLALSEQLGLNASVKYHPIKFSDHLAGVREYTGISFAVGIAYFLHKL